MTIIKSVVAVAGSGEIAANRKLTVCVTFALPLTGRATVRLDKMMTLRVVARIKARPDKVDEVRDALDGLVAPTRSEPGCIVYEMLQNTNDPTDFTFVEEWQSDAALAKHAASEHIKITRKKLDGIVEGAIDIRTYNLIK